MDSRRGKIRSPNPLSNSASARLRGKAGRPGAGLPGPSLLPWALRAGFPRARQPLRRGEHALSRATTPLKTIDSSHEQSSLKETGSGAFLLYFYIANTHIPL